MSEALSERDAIRDGTIWADLIFKLLIFIARGAFFPFFYGYLMIFGTRKYTKELRDFESCKQELEQKLNGATKQESTESV